MGSSGQLRDRADEDRNGRVADAPRAPFDAGTRVSTVLVPFDGSLLAKRAIDVAARLAASFGADLRLFKFSIKLDLRDEVVQLRSLADRHGLPRAQVEVSTGQSAAPAVIRTVRRATGPVVVMATHGKSGPVATVLGGVVDEVLRDIDAPMVLVGPAFEERGDPTRLVVCWDGSLLSASVVPAASSWARQLRIPVQLAHVHGDSEPPLGEGDGLAGGELTAQVVDALSYDDCPVEMIEIQADDTARGILDALEVDRLGALVALTTKGRGGSLSSSLGRVLSRIVQQCPHPLLVFHPRT